jgi:capsular polysaccharide biosynthesis protein
MEPQGQERDDRREVPLIKVSPDPAVKRDDDEYPSLPKLLRRNTRWILLSALVTSACAAIIQWYTPVPYTSSIVVLTNDEKQEEPNTGLRSTKKGSSKLLHLVTSTAMFDHLITHFGLYEHFEVDPGTPWAYERVSAILLKRISTRSTGDGTVMVTVHDMDREMARDMANEIYHELEEMVAASSRRASENGVALYQEIIASTNNHIDRQANELLELANSIAPEEQMGAPAETDGPKGTTREIGKRLNKLAVEISVAQMYLSTVLRTREAALAMERQERMPELYLARAALLDVHTSPNLNRLLTVAFVFFVTVLLGAIGTAVWWERGEDVLEYFRTGGLN